MYMKTAQRYWQADCTILQRCNSKYIYWYSFPYSEMLETHSYILYTWKHVWNRRECQRAADAAYRRCCRVQAGQVVCVRVVVCVCVYLRCVCAALSRAWWNKLMQSFILQTLEYTLCCACARTHTYSRTRSLSSLSLSPTRTHTHTHAHKRACKQTHVLIHMFNQVYTCIHQYMYTRAHTRTHTHAHAYTNTTTRTHIHMHTHGLSRSHTHMSIHLFSYANRIRTHAHIHTHTHTRTHTHTYMYVDTVACTEANTYTDPLVGFSHSISTGHGLCHTHSHFDFFNGSWVYTSADDMCNRSCAHV